MTPDASKPTLRERIEAWLPLFTLAEQTAEGALLQPLMVEVGDKPEPALALFITAEKAQQMLGIVGAGWSVVTFDTLDELAAWLRVAKRFAPTVMIDADDVGDTPQVAAQRILDAINRRLDT